MASTSRAKRAFEVSRDRARRPGLYALSSVCFHISLKSLAREKGTNKSLGLSVFLVKQGNQPQPNWAIEDVTEEYQY